MMGKPNHGSTKGKKKRKANDDITRVTDKPNNEEVACDDESPRELKRKTRKKRTDNSDCNHSEVEQSIREGVTEEISLKKKKKKRKKIDPKVEDVEDAEPVTESAGKKKQKKKDKHSKDKDCNETGIADRDGESVAISNGNGGQHCVEERKGRKKKKKSKHKEDVNDAECEEGSRKKKQKIKNVCNSSAVELDTNEGIECRIPESSNNCKKKKKKRKHDDNEDENRKKCSEDTLPLDVSKAEANVKKKKKKKHERKDIKDHNNSVVNNGHMHTSQEVENDRDEYVPKLKKNKKHVSEDGDEDKQSYNSLPFDYGNLDKSHCKETNTSRSYDDGGDGSTQNHGVASLDTKSGQWGTASFENKERQQKFLRLLGGFKKDSSTESKPLFGKLGKKGRNCALNREQEATLNVKLESEFDRAMSFKLSKTKSGGIGFQAPPGEGKKFYIDRTSSKSIKFNDSD